MGLQGVNNDAECRVLTGAGVGERVKNNENAIQETEIRPKTAVPLMDEEAERIHRTVIIPLLWCF
jgi:hypothetical protein